jgi:GMP synthase-like glutamine amidotransferase
MTGKNFLIVQHMEWEGPGQHLLAALQEAGAGFQVLRAWQEPVPPLDPFTGMIALGGSPNVDEEAAFPYLAALKAAIREAVASGKAYLGFCLGHQLLGHVLGCRVGPLPRKSVGFINGELTQEGLKHPVFEGLPARMRLFKWHGQGVLPPLPPGLHVLARSPGAMVEALGVAGNPRVLGLQFDNHVAARDVEQWLKHDRDWALADSGVDPEALTAAARAEEAAMGREFRRFFANFLRLAGT